MRNTADSDFRAWGEIRIVGMTDSQTISAISQHICLLNHKRDTDRAQQNFHTQVASCVWGWGYESPPREDWTTKACGPGQPERGVQTPTLGLSNPLAGTRPMRLANGRGHIFNPGRSQTKLFVQLLSSPIQRSLRVFGAHVIHTQAEPRSFSLTSPFLAHELPVFPNLVHSQSVFFGADCHFRSALINLSLSRRLPIVPTPLASTIRWTWSCVCSFPQFRFWFKQRRCCDVV